MSYSYNNTFGSIITTFIRIITSCAKSLATLAHYFAQWATVPVSWLVARTTRDYRTTDGYTTCRSDDFVIIPPRSHSRRPLNEIIFWARE